MESAQIRSRQTLRRALPGGTPGLQGILQQSLKLQKSLVARRLLGMVPARTFRKRGFSREVAADHDSAGRFKSWILGRARPDCDSQGKAGDQYPKAFPKSRSVLMNRCRAASNLRGKRSVHDAVAILARAVVGKLIAMRYGSIPVVHVDARGGVRRYRLHVGARTRDGALCFTNYRRNASVKQFSKAVRLYGMNPPGRL